MSDDLSNRINEAVDIFGGTLHGDFLVEVREEIERLRAEIERLREALEKIADDGNATGCNPQIMCNTARAALGEEKK